MLLSAQRHRLPDAHAFIAVDLGLAEEDRRRIERRFSWCALEAFPFDRYPPHVRRLGNFAWKPILVDEMLRQRGGMVLWLDSATLFHGSLDPVFERVARDGLFTLIGQSPLARCCDPRTLDRLRVAPEDLQKPYRCGGALGFDAERPDVRELVARWRELALCAECIDPPGHDPRTHKYDQALLTALLYLLAHERGLTLLNEEVDISSTNPVPWISTRNKVATWMPTLLDPAVRGYYAIYKRLDRMLLRWHQK